MDFLEDIEKITGNQYAAKGRTANDGRTTIDTGSYALNALLSGSIYGGSSSNSVTGYAGESSTGKTYLVLSTVKTYLENNEDGSVIFFESEGAISRQMLTERGIDADRMFIVPITTVQEFRSQAMKILNGYEELKESARKPMMFVLDSLGMLSTSKEVQDISDAKDTRDMTRAQLIRGTFRSLTLKLSLLGVPMFITNHTYTVMAAMFPTQEAAGGGGFKYAASTIVMLSKKKEKEGTDVVGNVIHCKTYKSRLSKENQQIDVRLYYDSGLDRYYGLLELAEKYGVIEKMGGRYVLPDGRKEYAKTIYKKPEQYFTKELMDAIDEVAKRAFSYGSSNETEEIKDDEDE